MSIEIQKTRSYYDILQLRRFTDNPNSISVAFPVLAYECEVRAPYENELDAYEEAALKYISIGLSIKGIAKTLNINESLSRQVVSKLEMEKFIIKVKGVGFKLTEAGEKYLLGIREERPSENSRFGFMFVSALKRDVLPYFYDGDIGKIDRTDGNMTSCKLTDKDEHTTFASSAVPKRWRLSKAYKSFLNVGRLDAQVEDEEISFIEAQDIYADFDSFDEAEYYEFETQAEIVTEENDDMLLGYGTFVRPLKRQPEKLYLKMQIVVSPDLPGGFIVESPLNLTGIDNEFFLRQVQWMLGKGDILYNGQSLNKLIDNEVLKLCGSAPIGEKSVSVFILEKLPLLASQKDRYSQLYGDVSDIYGLIGNNMTQIARESVVNGLNKKLLEVLLNRLLRSKTNSELQSIKNRVLSDMNALYEDVVQNIAKSAKIDRTCLPEYKIIRAAILKLDRTLGNSIAEKLINTLAVFCYLSSPRIKRFVTMGGLEECISSIMRLNAIRNKTSHDSIGGDMTAADYNYYISNVFEVANRLLEALEEKN